MACDASIAIGTRQQGPSHVAVARSLNPQCKLISIGMTRVADWRSPRASILWITIRRPTNGAGIKTSIFQEIT